jgi:hypothetical protein
VGAEHCENIIKAIVQYSEREDFLKHLKILIEIAVIYNLEEFKYTEISIFRNTAVKYIRKSRHT